MSHSFQFLQENLKIFSPRPVDVHVLALCMLKVIERHHILIQPQKCI